MSEGDYLLKFRQFQQIFGCPDYRENVVYVSITNFITPHIQKELIFCNKMSEPHFSYALRLTSKNILLKIDLNIEMMIELMTTYDRFSFSLEAINDIRESIFDSNFENNK